MSWAGASWIPTGHVEAVTVQALVVVEGRRKEEGSAEAEPQNCWDARTAVTVASGNDCCVEVGWFVLERKSKRYDGQGRSSHA
jgi:hypothetical protein